ncbi:MAG: hypothetical protein UW16_C0041G0002 [Microgenomates group bacterium GW2011_GWC1_44_10]|uniref:Uncharacterized protein n=1 Tax=Candidatus Woesebacteria bacterium GW2011_GWA2_44_33 TaxID=1618564 RepID=A0A0G1J4S8_9BACT|nr:MAG: hypothetical protein UW16_C0041G0002 [Microgenomates group bacterium GW2011_GWC1_44_10]KKT66285.1 MAG: hypothetical protein UW60_C0026G0001 [Candidatus Woesebacteria bacterium GW2011_GWA2_44_33]
MNRLVAILLLMAVLFGAWSVSSSPTAMASFDPANSPVLFTTDEGTPITLAWALFVLVAFVAWFALGVLLSSISPDLGYLYFRFTIELFVIFVLRQKDFKMSEKRGGNGSGNTSRVG